MPAHPFKVKAIYEYKSQEEDDLIFPEGQIITVTEDDEPDWYTGEYIDSSGAKQEGIFPRNFVEKYEPVAPPRPTRAPRPKKEAEPVVAAPEQISQQPAPKEAAQDQSAAEEHDQRPSSKTIPPEPVASQAPPVSRTVAPAPAPVPATASTKPAATAKAPPPVNEKPSGGSFKDRIAAFNKSAAPPPAPFKPGGLAAGSSTFIKKPFVAPPPSKDAYVPRPQVAAPVKIYKREEDPEIAAKEAENAELAEKAGLSPTSNDGDEDQPKPTSLKERIALLQKQQMEQAARHAEAAQKKEKPKRPAQKRADSQDADAGQDAPEPTLEKQDSQTTVGRRSMESQEDASAPKPVPRRKSSKGAADQPGVPRDSFGDGNEADMSGAGDETEETEETSTGRDEAEEQPRATPRPQTHEEPEQVAGEGQDDEDEEEEDEVDPEIRRREELRARMAKMSGGMGMVGMFGGPMPMPGPSLPTRKKTERSYEEPSSPTAHAPPVPMIPLPGMTRAGLEEINKQPEVEREDETPNAALANAPADEVVDVEDIQPTSASHGKSERPQAPARDSFSAPPVPGSRPAPPPVPLDSRPVLPPPQMDPSAGSESDDEMSLHAVKSQVDAAVTESLNRTLPPRPGPPPPPSRPADAPTSPRLPSSKRTSYLATEASEQVPSSPTSTDAASKRTSRVPPIPGSIPPPAATHARPPPPPPPAVAPLSRSSTGDDYVHPPAKHIEQDESEEEVTEYEGDYDTDIASAAPHKDALKSSATESTHEDNTPVRSPVTSPVAAPPPLPVHRPAPPPVPTQAPPVRQSADMPRAAPPPPPPPKEQNYGEDDEEYDPYRYTAPAGGGLPPLSIPPPAPPQRPVQPEEDIYGTSPPRFHPPPPQPPHESYAPPPPPRDNAPPAPPRAPPRQSMDGPRTPTVTRKSTDLNRMANNTGYIANDIDIGQSTLWWTQPNSLPPVLQNRKDLLHESEESTTTKRGGKSTTTRDVYLLFQDYSQTILTVRFDPSNPSDAQLEQRHEPPPPRLRQDQLEAAHERFGRKIAEAVSKNKDTVVGDGTPAGLVTELLKPFKDALLPIGTRAYGALVYSNLANASTSQFDEIRPGDIITLRNAKLQGKHGPMHAKYSIEVGGDGVGHVGVVSEWDGTKKKVRAWEQGRDGKGKKGKVQLESYKLDDLRSGEVRVWRVVERGWVGWEGENA